MAKDSTDTMPVIQHGAGPVIRQLEAEVVKAYQTQDRALLDSCRTKYNALKTLINGVKGLDNSAFDNATSGYVDAEWLNGVERLAVKIEPGTRGRKAAVKADPADLV